RQHCLERETTQARVYAGLATLLVPAWAPFDYLLGGDSTLELWGLRLIDVLAGLVVLHMLRRTARLPAGRALALVKMVFTGGIIAFMFPLVDEHFWPYVFGFSLVFWGAAVVFSMPMRVAAWASALILSIAVVGQLLPGAARTLGELV